MSCTETIGSSCQIANAVASASESNSAANGPAAGDDDVKTYPIKRKAEAAPAGTHVSETKAAAPKSVERKTAAPVQSTARSGGRHTRPEDSKKPARRAPGGYQGKH